MNRLVRFYNQNRHIIWIVILSIVAIIAIIQILNKFAYIKSSAKENVNNTNSSINSNYPVITGQEIKLSIAEIIDEFIEFCSNGQTQEAYKMLSDECKEVLYPTLEDFTKKYYNRIFNEKKTYIYQALISNNNTYTYKVDFTEDMLATGEPAKTSIVDYYTIVKNNDEYKLNINKFIGAEDINEKMTKDNVAINIKRKKIYMDYEIYDIEIVNNNQKTIILDDMTDTDNIYVEDSDGKKYYWYNNEFLESDITVRSSRTQRLSIKFNKKYNEYSKTTKVVFANIVLNNEILDINVEI